MGIAAKHAYRQFLKSDEWAAVRLACLARDGARCRLCKVRDLSNDAHHIRYPKRWIDTKVQDLITLCRRCHDHVHEVMERLGNPNWDKIRQEVEIPGVKKRLPGRKMAALHAPKARAKFLQLTIIVARAIHVRSYWTQTNLVNRSQRSGQ